MWKRCVGLAVVSAFLIVLIGIFNPHQSFAQAIRAAWVRDADNPARQHVAFDLSADNPIYTVPNGKTLVIEDVSMFMVTANGTLPAAGITVPANGTIYFHDLPFAPIGPDVTGTPGSKYWAGGRTTRIYADAGSNVGFFTNAQGHLACEGYLLDVNP